MKERNERTKWLLAAPPGALDVIWCDDHEDFHLTIRDPKSYEDYLTSILGSKRERRAMESASRVRRHTVRRKTVKQNKKKA